MVLDSRGAALIVNLRGTGGSGKSTVVRRVMAHYLREHELITLRKRPIGYRCVGGARTLYVPGHYETPAGGCDTLPTVDTAYALVRSAVAGGQDVLFEGIMVQDDVRRAVELDRDYPGQLVVIGLETPLDECLRSIRQRRAERGDDRELNPANTVSRQKRVRRALERLREAGVAVEEYDREGAYARCLELLGAPAVVSRAEPAGPDEFVLR